MHWPLITALVVLTLCLLIFMYFTLDSPGVPSQPGTKTQRASGDSYAVGTHEGRTTFYDMKGNEIFSGPAGARYSLEISRPSFKIKYDDKTSEKTSVLDFINPSTFPVSIRLVSGHIIDEGFSHAAVQRVVIPEAREPYKMGGNQLIFSIYHGASNTQKSSEEYAAAIAAAVSTSTLRMESGFSGVPRSVVI
jgi:hypothetical protein